MKTNIFLLLFLGITLQAVGQTQAETYIKEAQGFLAQKDYKQAQLSLQDAINDLNNLIGVQIYESLPNEINGLTSIPGEGSNGGATNIMGLGMTISKSYRNESKNGNEADVQIITSSPMLSAMNMYLSNPGMMGQEYKSIRIGTQRAIMKSEMQDNYDDNGGNKQIRSSELQIPFSQTLITINLRGFASEAEEIAFATKLDLAKLKMALGE